ncbi:MAG: RNA pseudouridine synthase [Chitinophagaceae bacterium]|nr:RNA pseudouridine synthase [Chitinophagaceae bacterium]
MTNLKEIILAETADWVAVNKPSGLLSIPDREGKEISLKVLLAGKYGHIYTVHRIDKDTSGLILFAKNEAAHRHLSLQFEERETEKIYQGLVLGVPAETKGRTDAAIAEHPVQKGLMVVHRKGKEAVTEYEVLEDFGRYALLQFRILTGRTHQIRVHMKNLGHPIVCDPLYGDGKSLLLSAVKAKFKLSKTDEEERPLMGRLALHAFRLGFNDTNGERVQLEAPLQKDMRATLSQLRKRLK